MRQRTLGAGMRKTVLLFGVRLVALWVGVGLLSLGLSRGPCDDAKLWRPWGATWGADVALGNTKAKPRKPQAGSATEFRALEQLRRQGAKVSAVVLDLENDRSLAELGSDVALSPASVTKLILAAALLERLGPDHTFQTKVYANGKIQGDTLIGDLVIQAGGDPGLTNEFLWRLSTDVARLGIRKITGSLVLETGLFAPIALADRDENRAVGASGSRNAYDSPLSAAAVNFSVLGVFVAPADVAGQPAAVALEPYPLASVTLRNEVKTVPAGSTTRIDVARVSRPEGDVLTASGTIAVGAKARTVYRSISDPDRYALDVYGAFLEAAGVSFGSKKLSREFGGFPQARPVLVLESQPLEWQLRGLLRQSNNFLADMLTIHLDQQKESGKTLAAGSRVLSRFLVDGEGKGNSENGAQSESASNAANNSAALNANANTAGNQTNSVRARGVRIASGSGLTPENRVSAWSLARVLERVYKNSMVFGHLYAALPGAGQEGTLRDRFEDGKARWLQGQLRAKTGTLTEPVVAVGLAGFSRTRSGHWAGFGIIVNGSAGSSGVTVSSARAAIEQDLERILRAN